MSPYVFTCPECMQPINPDGLLWRLDHHRDCTRKTRTPPAPAAPGVPYRATLVAQIREADEALADAEDELARIRRAEHKAAARVNLAALAASTLHRALEALDEVPRVHVSH